MSDQDLPEKDQSADQSAPVHDDQHPYLAQLYSPHATEAGHEVISRVHGMWGSGKAGQSGDTSGFNGTQRVISLTGTTQPPFGGWFDDVADRMAQLVPGFATRIMVHRNQITFFVDPEKLQQLALALRDDELLRFEVCVSVSGVHYPEQTDHELHAVFHLLSMTYNRRIALEVEASEDDPHVPSLTPIYPMANFHERETWDMFGIIFDGHPGLTRILMPDDWVGHPQRKDYPLGGIPVEFKGATVPPADERRSYNR